MFYKYPHISQFRDVVDYINHNYEEKPIIVFEGTTKLHGTNGAIVYTLNDKYLIQSRNRTLCLEHDNQGFFQFMNQTERKSFLTSVLKEKLLEENKKKPEIEGIVLFGEFAGENIQKGVAISNMKKFFAPFDVMFIVKDNENLIPAALDILKDFYSKEHRIFPIPFINKPIVLPILFKTPKEMANILEFYTKKVEEQCPFAKHFGIEGIGEGIVWKGQYDRKTLMFKTKGKKHATVKVKKELIPVDYEERESVMNFINDILTDRRLEQGIEYFKEMEIPVTIQNITKFIKWVSEDVIREEENTILNSEFDSKKLIKSLNTEIAKRYKKMLEEF